MSGRGPSRNKGFIEKMLQSPYWHISLWKNYFVQSITCVIKTLFCNFDLCNGVISCDDFKRQGQLSGQRKSLKQFLTEKNHDFEIFCLQSDILLFTNKIVWICYLRERNTCKTIIFLNFVFQITQTAEIAMTSRLPFYFRCPLWP